jgi:acylglycerol lipase
MFCLGMSLGGLSTYFLTLTHAHLFEGAILMAPALRTSSSKVIMQLTRFLYYFLPEWFVVAQPGVGYSNRNLNVVEEKVLDNLYYLGGHKISTVNFLFNSAERSQLTFKDYRCPFLIVMGGMDKLVDPTVAF